MSGLPKRRRSPYTQATADRRALQTQDELQQAVAAFRTILKSHPNLIQDLVSHAHNDIRRPLHDKLVHMRRRLLFHFLRTQGYTANEIQSIAKLATNTILYHEQYLDKLLYSSTDLQTKVTAFYEQIVTKLEKPI